MVTTVAELMDEIEAHAARLVSRLSANIVAELKKVTPVDVGWAANAWTPGIGDSVFEGIEALDLDEEGLSRTDRLAHVAAIAAASDAGAAQVARYSWGDGAVFIFNGVPYIVRLNEGYSKKAPAGFVQEAIERGIRATQREFS